MISLVLRGVKWLSGKSINSFQSHGFFSRVSKSLFAK